MVVHGFWLVSMVFHGFWLVSMVFQGGFMVFHGFWLVSMVFHGFWLVSMVFQGLWLVSIVLLVENTTKLYPGPMIQSRPSQNKKFDILLSQRWLSGVGTA